MTRRQEFDKAISSLTKIKNEEVLNNSDWALWDIIHFLERVKPKPYESRAKSKCICGNSGRNLAVSYGMGKCSGLFRIKCCNCNRTTAWCKTEKEAIKVWNESVSLREK